MEQNLKYTNKHVGSVIRSKSDMQKIHNTVVIVAQFESVKAQIQTQTANHNNTYVDKHGNETYTDNISLILV